MRSHNSDTTVALSKTGLIKRTVMQLDGSENVSRTGVFKRSDRPVNPEADENREPPPPPPTLPEVNNDDGGTTGFVTYSNEGEDKARRENHPRQ